jgi:hypothetical protein
VLGRPVPPCVVIDALDELVERSLVVADTSDDAILYALTELH